MVIILDLNTVRYTLYILYKQQNHLFEYYILIIAIYDSNMFIEYRGMQEDMYIKKKNYRMYYYIVNKLGVSNNKFSYLAFFRHEMFFSKNNCCVFRISETVVTIKVTTSSTEMTCLFTLNILKKKLVLLFKKCP